jgi:hypothetical protein
MTTKHANEAGESRSWIRLGQVGAISAAVGLLVGFSLGAAGRANAPESNAGTAETAYAAAHFDHSRIAATDEPDSQPATF